jgi:hypothetical protein
VDSTQQQARIGISVIVADPDMRAYVSECLNQIPGVQLLDSNTDIMPDLIVCDDQNIVVARDIPRLVVLDEPPDASAASGNFILTPFDARDLVRAALRLI